LVLLGHLLCFRGIPGKKTALVVEAEVMMTAKDTAKKMIIVQKNLQK